MVKLAILNNCNKCNKVKQALKNNKHQYTEYDCDKFPNYCDLLEDISKVVNYPMMVMQSSEDVLELYFVIDDYNQLHLDGSNIRGYILRPKLNINTLIQSINTLK